MAGYDWYPSMPDARLTQIRYHLSRGIASASADPRLWMNRYWYVSRILTKLGVRDRVQAVVYAYRRGLVT